MGCHCCTQGSNFGRVKKRGALLELVEQGWVGPVTYDGRRKDNGIQRYLTHAWVHGIFTEALRITGLGFVRDD